MTLDQVIREVDRLDKEDFRLLVEHIEQRQKQEWLPSQGTGCGVMNADVSVQ